MVFWDVKPGTLVCLCSTGVLGEPALSIFNIALLTWTQRKQVYPKRRYISTKLLARHIPESYEGGIEN
jgi:hypothetical protein